MAEREAAIKLTLDDGQFVAAMGKAGDAAVRSAQRSERAMQVFGAGVEKATTNLRTLGGTARSSLGLASGLLGGMTFAGAIRGAVELDAKFKQLAFNVSRVTKEQVKAADIQKLVEQAAIKTGRRTAEMVDVFADLFQATGDSKFTADMLETIAVAATGADLSVLAGIADQLHTKFGVAANEMGDLFASLHEIEQGGNSMAEFAGVVGTLGAELQHAGLTGARGIKFLIGALAATEDPLGDIGKQVKGIKQILLSLGDVNQIKGIAKALHIDPKKLLNEKDLIGRLKKILSMAKGADVLKASMGEAEERKALKVMFLDPFEDALKRAQATGLKGKAATDKALEDLEKHIDEFGSTASKGADLTREANERRNDPERRLNAALDELQRSFSDPRIIDAVEDLSKYLPDVAEAFGKFAKFAAKNPWLTGTALVGGKAGMGFLEGAINEALTNALTGGSGGGGGGKGGGKGAAAKRAGAIERWQQFHDGGLDEATMIANSVEDGVEEGGKKGAPKLAKAIQAATQLALVAAVAGAVYEVGKEQLDNAFDATGDAMNELEGAGAAASSKHGPVSKHKAEAERLRKAIRKAKDESGGFVEGLFGALAGGSPVGGAYDPMGMGAPRPTSGRRTRLRSPKWKSCSPTKRR